MPLVLCLFGLACAAAVWISLHPPKRPGTVALGAWFVCWLVGELPFHQIALQLGVGSWLIAAGGLNAWPGWLGLGGLAVALAGLGRHISLASRASELVEHGLRKALGNDYWPRSNPPAANDQPINWRDLALIFPFRPRSVERNRDVVYHQHGRMRLRLDVYRDRALTVMPPATRRPVFMFVHGGAWVIGNKGQQGRPTVHHLATNGWVCVSINYRLSPWATFPDHLIDVKRALAWVKANIARYGGDPEFIVIGGGSAGGHLSSLVALTAGDPAFQPGFEDADLTVQGCVGLYGVYDFVDDSRVFRYRAYHDLLLARLVMKRSIKTDRASYQRASPVCHIKPDAPPFLMMHGDRDNLAPIAQARRFRDELSAISRSPVAWVELPGAQHAFELFPSLRSVVCVDGVHRFCQAIWNARTNAQPNDRQ